jgi:hypothetical protein
MQASVGITSTDTYPQCGQVNADSSMVVVIFIAPMHKKGL